MQTLIDKGVAATGVWEVGVGRWEEWDRLDTDPEGMGYWNWDSILGQALLISPWDRQGAV